MRKIKKIQDVVDWGLCVGCGACVYMCNRENAVTLINVYSVGIRPKFDATICRDCCDCLAACPGYRLEARVARGIDNDEEKTAEVIGPSYAAFEGHSADREIQFKGSSGGVLSALAVYCLEKEDMAFVLHTGMDEEKPWQNKTVISRTKDEILHNAGSRYCTSSPCELLKAIEESEKPCIFIGKPCDVAAVDMARRLRPKLDKNLGLVLSFFCAGTPNTDATIELVKQLGIQQTDVKEIKYRGEGWPGFFRVKCGNCEEKKRMTYEESWGRLSKRRPFRCQLCPDGLGELSDITSGDAWSKYTRNKEEQGLSHVLVRSAKGDEILQRAIQSGYLKMKSIPRSEVVRAQGLVRRRKMLYGRLIALRILCVPSTEFINFQLLKLWYKCTPLLMIKTILGTLKRVLKRGLWHRNRINQ